MKILKLTAENVKRLKAVEVTPDGDLVVIGGHNDAGKSSLLDAIEMAMGGEKATPSQPVRRGQDKAKVILDLGDIVVTRQFTAGGGRKLEVANKAGAVFKSPQAMLDRLYGALSFDALAFERLQPKEQAEALRGLVGLDLSELDGERQRLFNERAEQNRTVKAMEVKSDSCPRHEEAPAEEVSIAGLSKELAEAERLRSYSEKMGTELRTIDRRVETAEERCQAWQGELAAAKKRVVELGEALAEAEAKAEELRSQALVAQMQASEAAQAVPDTSAIRAKLEAAEGINAKVRENRQREQALAALKEARGASRQLSDRIDGVEARRLEALAAVAYPVPGLGIGDDGILLDGLPFEQASTSDRIRVSVAIGMAMNPELRVLLVRDGSLLGSEKLRLLAEMAKAAGVQVWLEMLQEAPDDRTTVFIEDGSVSPKGKPQQPRLAMSQAEGI